MSCILYYTQKQIIELLLSILHLFVNNNYHIITDHPTVIPSFKII